MRRILSLLTVITVLLPTLLLIGCQSAEEPDNKNQPTRTVVELNENNYWKYFNVTQSGNIDDEMPTVSHEINGVLDYALYEDVVFAFDIIYFTDGQSDDQYQSYTIRVACNAAGDAAFETTYLGLTSVTIGKWLGSDGNLVSLIGYNWKIHFKSIEGRIIYTV